MIRETLRIHRHSIAVFAALLGVVSGTISATSVSAQQIPAWRKPQSQSIHESQLSIRIALKPNVQCTKNVIELADIADLSGSEAIILSLRNTPIGPAPMRGSRQTWRQDDLLALLKLRGIDERQIQWAGDDACQVIRMDTLPVDKAIDYVATDVSPQLIAAAERNIASIILGYLKSKSLDATSWTIKPTISSDYAKLFSQKRSIRGISGGAEPWTGEQVFDLLIVTPQGDQTLHLNASIEVPKMVWGATGPLAKGRVIGEGDLKLVRLTPTMKASENECFIETDGLIGKELRRSISTGQPVLRVDVGSVRTIQARDQVDVRVVSGGIVVQTAGRAIMSGGIDEVIEVEIIGTKKRLAARVIQGNLVEAIAR